MKRKGLLAALAILIFGSIPCVHAGAESVDVPELLKLNLLETPYGIAKEEIRFSWSFSGKTENCQQSAYRIRIGNRTTETVKEYSVYDSGWIEESRSSGIKLDGLSDYLNDNELYYWSVQIRTQDNMESGWAAPQAFTTAIGNEWESVNGIWGDAGSAFEFLRTSFSLGTSKTVEKIIAGVTAASPEPSRQYVYDFYVNGTQIGTGPSRLQGGMLYYHTYDITDEVKKGTNIIGAICYTEEVRSFLCQITVFYTDGTKEILVNSGRDAGEWTALDANEIFGNRGKNIGVNGYYYASTQNMNGTLYPYDWQNTSYAANAASGWKTAQKKESITTAGTLAPYPADNMKRHEQPAETVQKLADGSYVIDLGQEIVGSLRLSVNSPSVQNITISYGEEKNEDGSVRSAMRTGNVYVESWTLKKGSQVLEDNGMKTFRYVQISGYNGTITKEMVTGIPVRQEFSAAESSFSSSNELLNDIYGLTKNTIRETSQDLYVDSQSRERGAYEGDVLINMLSAYSFEDDYSLARHSLDYVGNNPTWPAEYQLFVIMGAWQDYLYTGDDSYLIREYDQLKEKLYDSYFDEEIGLVKNPKKTLLIDWPATERDGYDTGVFYNTVFNSLCVGAYQDMASIAAETGHTEDAHFYAQRAEIIRSAMIARLYSIEDGRFCDGLTQNGEASGHMAQHSTAYSLAYGIYDGQDMADTLSNSIESDGFVEMSVYGTFFLLQGLYESNNGTLARQIMANPNVNEGVRSWAYMLYESDATLTTEAWNVENKPNMTYSHPWGSAPASQIVRGMFGIQPLSAGFEAFQIKLQPGGIAAANVELPTIKGTVYASYEMIGDGTLVTSITVPANTRAIVYIPTLFPEKTTISVNGTETEAVYENGYLYLELGSGIYEIRSESGLYEDETEWWTNASVLMDGYQNGNNWIQGTQDGAIVSIPESDSGYTGLKMVLSSAGLTGSVQYDVHLSHVGWFGTQMDGEVAGSPSDSGIIEAVKISLTGEIVNYYDIYYRVETDQLGWLGWAKNGEAAGTTGYGMRVRQVQVKLAVKNYNEDQTKAAFIDKAPTLNYRVHAQSYGWMSWMADGALAGTTGETKRLEAIQINLGNLAHGNIEYRTYVQSYGWLGWKMNGESAGTTGEAKRLEAIQIRLTGELAQKYDVYYRVHAQSFGWLGWAKNGESAGTADYAKRLEAIEIRLVPRGGEAPGSTAQAFCRPQDVCYHVHAQSYGWLEWVKNGALSGTIGEAKRLESIQVQLSGIDGGVEYCSYVQSYGWLGWVKDGAISGTTGEAKRMEAIRIRLTGNAANQYDIYYRVHAQSYGWLGWAKNGDPAGTAHYAKRLEAIEIRLVSKGGSAPGSMSGAFQEQKGIYYQCLTQGNNWLASTSNGALGGTVGEGKQLEAIRITLANMETSGGVRYRSYVQSYGWQSWVNDGVISGTEGLGKRLEAIQIQLTGKMAEKYDVFYQVHVQGIGWMDWVRNGETAGTMGQSRRIEAIRIRLVEKTSEESMMYTSNIEPMAEMIPETESSLEPERVEESSAAMIPEETLQAEETAASEETEQADEMTGEAGTEESVSLEETKETEESSDSKETAAAEESGDMKKSEDVQKSED